MAESGNRISDYLRTFDRFAEPVNLNIDGKSGVKTLFGTFLSILHNLSLFAVFIYLLFSYYKADRPTINSAIEISNSFAETDLLEHGLMPAFVWQKAYGYMPDVADIDKYLTAELVVTVNKVDVLTQKVTWATCDPRYYSHFTTDSVYTDLLKSALCINYSDSLVVSGQIGSNTSRQVSLKFKPCVLGGACKSPSELSDLTFSMVTPIVAINHLSFYYPVSRQATIGISYGFLASLKQSHNIYTRQSRIKDFSGIFPSWKETFNTPEVYDIRSSMMERSSSNTACTDSNLHDNAVCESYHDIVIRASNLVFTTERVYPYLYQQFAVIGGLNNLLAILFVMIYSRYNAKVKENLILKHVFGFIEELEVLKGAKSVGIPQPVQNPGRKCFCLCKKKVLTAEERAHQQLKQSALMNMRENMDILNIVKELNQLKVLCSFFFKGRHSKVASFLELGIYQRNRFEREQMEALGGFSRRSSRSKRKNVIKLNFGSKKQSYPWPLTLQGSAKFLNFHHALRDIEDKASQLKNCTKNPKNEWEKEDEHQTGILGDLEDKIDEFFFNEIMKNTESQQRVLGYARDEIDNKKIDSVHFKEDKGLELKAQPKVNFGSLLNAVLHQSDSGSPHTQHSEISNLNLNPEAKGRMHNSRKKSSFAPPAQMIQMPVPVVHQQTSNSATTLSQNHGEPQAKFQFIKFKPKIKVNSIETNN